MFQRSFFFLTGDWSCFFSYASSCWALQAVEQYNVSLKLSLKEKPEDKLGGLWQYDRELFIVVWPWTVDSFFTWWSQGTFWMLRSKIFHSPWARALFFFFSFFLCICICINDKIYLNMMIGKTCKNSVDEDILILELEKRLYPDGQWQR